MAALTWSEALALQQPQIDDTHQEFVALLGALEADAAGPADALQDSLSRFIAHTEAHFSQEDAWMARIGFEPGNCHTRQHKMVLELLQAVQDKLRNEGDTGIVRQLVPALAEWFVPHAQNMDGGLVHVMQLTGFDPATGSMSNPPQPASAITTDAAFEAAAAGHACGSAGCA